MFSKLFVRTAIARTPLTLQRATSIGQKRCASTAEHRTTNNNHCEQSYQSYFTHNPVEGYIRNSPFDTVTTPNIALDQYVWQNVSKWQNHVATVCGITGRSYTYARLRDHSAALAIRLQKKLNMHISDVIAICLPNIPEFPIATLGSIEAGLVVTTMNPIYTVDDIQRQLLDSNAKFIIGTAKIFDKLQAAVDKTNKNIGIICIKTDSNEAIPQGAIDFSELIDPQNIDFSSLRPHKRHPDEIVFLPYSSGTTGLPKGVMLSHNNIGINCEQLGVKFGEDPICFPTTDEYQDVFPAVLPFFHIYGFTALMISKVAVGAKIVTLPEFNPKTFVNSITEHKATLLQVVPPILIYLANDKSVSADALSTVRIVMSGAAPLGALDVERFQIKSPNASIIQGYGLTETSPLAMANIPGNTKYASIGSPASATRAKIVRINDDSGFGLGANETGELWVKGPQNMLGYLNNPKATNETLIDGWVRTGDIAYYDENGYFYITDRLKELIKVKGYQVAPAELEEILRSHPDVADAAVVGVPHPKTAEAPRAFVVRKVGSQVNEQDIQKFVADKVVDYKQLNGGVHFIDTIPKNTTGKIMRREIKLKYCQ